MAKFRVLDLSELLNPTKGSMIRQNSNRGAFLFRLWDCLARTRNLLRNEDEALFRAISRYTGKARANEPSILEEHHEIHAFNTWAYSCFPSWLPAYPLDDAIRRLAAIGYDGVEIGCAAPHAWPAYLSAERRAELRRLLNSCRLQTESLLAAPGGTRV